MIHLAKIIKFFFELAGLFLIYTGASKVGHATTLVEFFQGLLIMAISYGFYKDIAHD